MKTMPMIGTQVRVAAKKPSHKWTQGGKVEGISMNAMMVYVRYPDDTSEWAELERVELQQEPSIEERAAEVQKGFHEPGGRRRGMIR